MSVRAVSNAWQFSQFGGGRLLALLAIADQADDTGVSWPTVESIAARSRLSVRQVQRVTEDLLAADEIDVWKWTSPSTKNERNCYRVLLGELTVHRGEPPDGLLERHSNATITGRRLPRGDDLSPQGPDRATPASRDRATTVSGESLSEPLGKPKNKFTGHFVTVGEERDQELPLTDEELAVARDALDAFRRSARWTK